MRKPCTHGVQLPRGLVCDQGYLYIRVFYKGKQLPKIHCGPHTKKSEKYGTIRLNQEKEKIFFGKIGVEQELPDWLMKDVCEKIYLKHVDIASKGFAEQVIRDKIIPTLGNLPFGMIDGGHIAKWREKRLADKTQRFGTPIRASTVNRWQAILSSIFSSVETWVKIREDGVPQIRLPKENPCAHVAKESEKKFRRQRVPSDAEMKAAKAWLMENDPELWQIMLAAIVTFLRKKDLHKHLKTGERSGFQAKTGERFKVRADVSELPEGATINLRKRWDRFRKAMGWFDPTSERHTVWHDLRHWGPSFLGNKGYSRDLIKKLTGHATVEMADLYTHLSDERAEEAANLVKSHLEAL